jgi:hypothetical protein
MNMPAVKNMSERSSERSIYSSRTVSERSSERSMYIRARRRRGIEVKGCVCIYN